MRTPTHWITAGLAVTTLVILGSTRGRSAERSKQATNRSATELSESANRTMGLRASHVARLELPAVGLPQHVHVPIENQTLELQLEVHSVRSPIYQVLAQVYDGSYVEMEPGAVRTVRGFVVGHPDQHVAGGFGPDGLVARVVLNPDDVYWIEPLRPRMPDAHVNDYVIYRADDVVDSGAQCAMAEVRRPRERVGRDPLAQQGGACGGQLCVAELACDADVEYFEDFGSVSAVESRINLITNLMNPQYEDDVQITHVITTIIVRTAEPDPYTTTNASSLVSQFRSHWLANHTGVQRDVAQLFTGKDIFAPGIGNSVIGIAFNIGVMCTSQSYCVVESNFNGVNGSTSCKTDLSAHELGHLWNGFHCSCPGWTMNSGLTCANQFHPSLTIPGIVSHRNSRTCLDADTCDNNGDCNDGNPCTTDECIGSECVFTNNSDSCNDGNLCTEDDTCSGGTCTGTPLDCGDGDPCTTDICSAGNCQNNPIDCSDGNPCTDDSCVGGTCQNMNNSNSCNDVDACTENDVCSGGVCSGTPVDCNDGDPCTNDSCNGATGCQNSPVFCSDGNVCTTDSCVGGSCVFTNNTQSCSDGDPCTVGDSCNSGSCNGTPIDCDDGDACTTDTCSGGVCQNVETICSDNNPCTFDECVDGECEYTPTTGPCSDFDVCTENDACVDGDCIGTPIDCDDGDPCTVDACDAFGDCTHSPSSGPCDDGDPCTTGDTCIDNVCVGGEAVDCDDGDICTDDFCESGEGCQHVNNDAPCDDGVECTISDVCNGGVCAGQPLDCDDGEPCTDDDCDVVKGMCVNTPNNDPCDDGEFCTENDTCSGGGCAGTLYLYGDVNRDGIIDIQDIFCVLDGFQSMFDNCPEERVDIAGTTIDCGPDGLIDIQDVFGVLDAFQDMATCCVDTP